MAATITCSVPGCGRMFIPGKGGGAGKCNMHFMRDYRNSKNPNHPGLLRDGSRTAGYTVYIDDDTSERVRLLAAAEQKGISEWIRGLIERETRKR